MALSSSNVANHQFSRLLSIAFVNSVSRFHRLDVGKATQATHRIVASGIASGPPEKLTPTYMKEHAGDRHGPPDEHRAQFPDGRVGSHSALAKPEHGKALLKAVSRGLAKDYSEFLKDAIS